MKTKLLKAGVLNEHSAELGKVARKLVRERAVELAIINGRTALDVARSDWDQAKLELAGESVADPQPALLESVPESARWDPVPGSSGHKVPAVSTDDEDDEGRSIGERLVEEGIAGAEQDQIVQATREDEEEA